jgi:hypothetical protein
MAKNDRVTVRLTDASTIDVIARGSGASVDFKTDREWLTVEELNGARRPEPIRTVKVAVGSVAAIIRDRVGDRPGDVPSRIRRRRKGEA